LFQLNFIHNTR